MNPRANQLAKFNGQMVELGVRVHFLSFIGSDPQFPEGNSNVTFCSNAEPLSRVATSANPWSTADEPLRHAAC